jgi:hypothetical protein
VVISFLKGNNVRMDNLKKLKAYAARLLMDARLAQGSGGDGGDGGGGGGGGGGETVPLERGDRALATPVNQDYVQDGKQYTNLEYSVAKVNGRLGLTLFKSDCKRYWRIKAGEGGGAAQVSDY